jgi:hypothetical protein
VSAEDSSTTESGAVVLGVAEGITSDSGAAITIGLLEEQSPLVLLRSIPVS